MIWGRLPSQEVLITSVPGGFLLAQALFEVTAFNFINVGVTHVFTYHQIDDVFTDVFGMVADSLQRLGTLAHAEVGFDLIGVFDHAFDQMAIQFIEMGIDDLVSLRDFNRFFRIQSGQGIQ